MKIKPTEVGGVSSTSRRNAVERCVAEVLGSPRDLNASVGLKCEGTTVQ